MRLKNILIFFFLLVGELCSPLALPPRKKELVNEESVFYFGSRSTNATVAYNEKSIRVLRSHFLDSPSNMPYNLSTDPLYIAMKHGYRWAFVDDFLKILFQGVTRRLFVEAGAFDGEFMSDTLRMEKEFGWTGLLIEPNPSNYQELIYKRRKAWTSNTCLADINNSKVTQFVSFKNWPRYSWISEMVYKSASHEVKTEASTWYEPLFMSSKFAYEKVQCFPLITYLQALNMMSIDLISLDIQGRMRQILEEFPFGKVSVKVFVISFQSNILPDPWITTFFKIRGYQLLACEEQGKHIFFLKEAFRHLLFPTAKECDVTLKPLL